MRPYYIRLGSRDWCSVSGTAAQKKRMLDQYHRRAKKKRKDNKIIRIEKTINKGKNHEGKVREEAESSDALMVPPQPPLSFVFKEEEK